MKKLSLVLVLFLLVTTISFTPPVAFAADNTFEVDDTGWTADANAGDGNCADAGANCTLRAAIEEANATAGSDEITFAPALYGGGAATINASTIDLTGSDTTITGPGGDDIIVDFGNGGGFNLSAQTMTITGLKIQNTNAPCIGIGHSDMTISNNTITDCGTEGVDLNTGVAGPYDNITITGNTFSLYDANGLTLGNAIDIWGTGSASNIEISSNTITGVAGQTAISVGGDSGTSNVTIKKNNITGGGTGIWTNHITTLTIGGSLLADANTYNGNGKGVDLENSGTVTVSNNDLTTTENGIEFENVDSATISYNTVNTSADSAGAVSADNSCSDLTISNNDFTVSGGGSLGINSSASGTNTLSDNTVTVSGAGTHGLNFSTVGTATVSDNIINLNSTGTSIGILFYTVGAGSTASGNTVNGADNAGTIGILFIGSSGSSSGNTIDDVGIGLSFGISGVAGCVSATSTNETLTSVDTAIRFDETGTSGNTVSDMVLPSDATTDILSDTGGANTNTLTNVEFDNAKVTVTSGVVDVNFDVRVHAVYNGADIENGTITATDTDSTSTAMGDTDASGLTAYATLDAWQVDSTGVINNKNDYTFAGTHSSYDNSSVTATIEEPDQQVELTFTYTPPPSGGGNPNLPIFMGGGDGDEEEDGGEEEVEEGDGEEDGGDEEEDGGSEEGGSGDEEDGGGEEEVGSGDGEEEDGGDEETGSGEEDEEGGDEEAGGGEETGGGEEVYTPPVEIVIIPEEDADEGIVDGGTSPGDGGGSEESPATPVEGGAGDHNGDGVGDFAAVVLGVSSSNDDPDGDGYTNAEEIFMGLDPNKYDRPPVKPYITNLNGVTTGAHPSFRLRGAAGDNVSVYLLDGASYESGSMLQDVFIGSTVIDAYNKGEIHTSYALPDGVHYAVAKGNNGYGDVVKFTVDASAALASPTFTGTEVELKIYGVDFSLGYYTNMTIYYWDGKYGFDSGGYVKERIAMSNVLIVRGHAGPKQIVYLTMKSVIYSSVVLSDASGYFEAKIYTASDLTQDKDHTVLSYTTDQDGQYMSNVSVLPENLKW